MPLTFNIRHVEKDDLELSGDLPAQELDLQTQDDMVRVVGDLEYDLVAQRLEGAILVQGHLHLDMSYNCVRCLTEFEQAVDLPDWTCHLPLIGDDAVTINNDVVDLTPYVREDILLALPQHPLCKSECGGLEIPDSVKEPGRKSGQTPSAWDELNKLKL